jgi:hypothetical protein
MHQFIIKQLEEKNKLMEKSEKVYFDKMEYAKKHNIVEGYEHMHNSDVLEKYYELSVEENIFLEEALSITNNIMEDVNFDDELYELYCDLVNNMKVENYNECSILTDKINKLEKRCKIVS